MATVGLRTEKSHRPTNRAATLRAEFGRRAVLSAAMLLSLTAIGCASFPGSHAATAAPAGSGFAPVYAPQAPAIAAPPAAVASPAVATPAVVGPPVSFAAPVGAGSPIAAPPPYVPQTTIVARPDLRSPPGVQLSPGVVVAPLNANVIVVAGIAGPERQLMPFQRVDWSLAPGSVGQIITVGDAPNSSLRGLVSERPTSLSPNYAVGQTFGDNLVVTRGTSSARDDLTILRGQTWIGLTSVVEGDTAVTALAPDIADPATRQQTAVIHWVDVRWIAPPPTAALPGGRVNLTTRVMRQTSGAPVAAWPVRYTIVGGPPAAFANGLAEVETVTDARGEASVGIMQPTPAAGVNPIVVRLARPAGPSGERLEIGAGATQVTWTTAPALPTAPPAISAAPVPGLIPSLANPSVQPQLPAQPPAIFQQPMLQPGPQPLGLQPLGPQSLTTAPPAVWPAAPTAIAPPIIVPAPAAVRPPASPPSNAPPARPIVEMQFTGPGRTFVGGQVAFDLILLNRSNVRATGLVLVDRFDDGLVHPAGVNPIQKGLDPLGPYETRRLTITFKAVKSGRLCNLIELSGDGGLSASAQACVESEAVRLTPTPTPITPSPATPNPLIPAPAAPTPTIPAPTTPPHTAPNKPVRHSTIPSPAHAAANLKLLIASRANPIKTGRETSYQIVVTNEGTDAETKVSLSITIPSVMQFVGSQERNPSPATIDGPTVRFDPIKQLRPHESLVFEIRVRAERAGTAIVRVEVRSDNLTKPLATDAQTTVFAEP